MPRKNLKNADVEILSSHKDGCYQKVIGLKGFVAKDLGYDEVGVKFGDRYNCASNEGLYWFSRCELKILNNHTEENNMAKLSGYKLVAVIENGSYSKQDYYYALYDTYIQKGDTVVVSGTAKGQILTVKDTIDPEDDRVKDINITEEVITSVSLCDYQERVAKRKQAEEIRKQMNKRKKEIEARKDDEHYASIDAGYAALLKKLNELGV